MWVKKRNDQEEKYKIIWREIKEALNKERDTHSFFALEDIILLRLILSKFFYQIDEIMVKRLLSYE